MADSVIEPSYSPLSQKNDQRGFHPFGNPGKRSKEERITFPFAPFCPSLNKDIKLC
jgi:hypothetical protein